MNRLTRSSLAAVAIASAIASYGQAPAKAQTATAACGIDMRVLVISASGEEADFPAITTALGYVGVPHEVFIASQHPEGLQGSKLSSGCHANYQGVILTTNELGYAPAGGGWTSAFAQADFDTLAAYEAHFGIRQVTWFTYPTPTVGFNWLTGTGTDVLNPPPPVPGEPPLTPHDAQLATPVFAQLTAAGSAVFSYLNPGATVPIQYATIYQSTPFDAATTPLLTDGQGHTLAAVYTAADGRANLAMVFDSNPYLVHSMLLSYGVVNWVTGGLFIGDRHVYMSPQVDDLFIDNTHWTGSTTAGMEGTACGTPVDNTGGALRMTATDLTAVTNWQKLRRADQVTATLRLTLAFNGVGTTGLYSPDTLTPAAKLQQGQYRWVSHTWDHETLDAPAMTYAGATAEIVQNNALATQLGLLLYSPLNLVQPNVSGLANPEFLQAAYDTGIRYLVSDTSRPGQDNPAPNVGRWNAVNPAIFEIPRRPNNLFFNVAAPSDWVSEYNCLYQSYWGRDLTYAEILDVISEELLGRLLRGELDPWMFHQPNLIAYDGVHTLLTDLLDVTLSKYRGYFTLPVLTPAMNLIGVRMANRTLAFGAGVSGMIQPGVGVQLTSPVDMTIPVTGLKVKGAEVYGGQSISWITLKANQPRLVPASELPGVQPPVATAGPWQKSMSLLTVTLSGSGTDLNSPPRPLTFNWTQTSGPAVTLANAQTAVASFVAPVLKAGTTSATLGFALTVSNDVLSTVATTKVTVFAPKPPIVTAGASQTVNWATLVTLTGTGTDPNVPALPLTFTWRQTSGTSVTLSDPHSAITTFTAPNLAVGAPNVVLGFRLTVSNGASSASASTSVTVLAPKAPIAKAASSQTVLPGSPVVLAGSAIDRNVMALPLTVAWTQTAGPAVALTPASGASVGFTAPALPVGTKSVRLRFKLSASNGLAASTATTRVVVRRL